jgi:hypothetical protein
VSKDQSLYFSPNASTLPSGNSIVRNDFQVPSMNSGNEVASKAVPKLNEASSTEIVHSLFCPARSTMTVEMMEAFGSTRIIETEESCMVAPLVADRCNCESIFRQASRTQKATFVEISFIHLTFLIGKGNAEKLAEKIGLMSIISPPARPRSTGDQLIPVSSRE